jgi:hypothetical protein
LKKLETEFSPERTADLSPNALKQIEKLRDEHRRAISAFARTQMETLVPIANLALGPAPVRDGLARPALPAANPATGLGPFPGRDISTIAEEQNDLTRALFTTSELPMEVATSLSRLLELLHQM